MDQVGFMPIIVTPTFYVLDQVYFYPTYNVL